MKEYEIHASVTYTSQGGTQEYDSFLEYVTAKNASEAKKILRADLKADGFTTLNMDAIVC